MPFSTELSKFILRNPNRVLGIYANSTQKERVANMSKAAAFLKVKKIITFPLDLPCFFSDINRTLDSLNQANSELMLPADCLRFAQFWFLKVTHIDDIAFNHLIDGNIDLAMEIWSRKENITALQNRIICNLVKGQHVQAIFCAEQLYSTYGDGFVALIDPTLSVSEEKLIDNFISMLSADGKLDFGIFVSIVSNTTWKKVLRDKILEDVSAIINQSKETRGEKCEELLASGKELCEKTRNQLAWLKKLVPEKDVNYSTIADNLGLEILQCAIDSYNLLESSKTAVLSMQLLHEAQKIVVGQRAKSKCSKNESIFQEIVGLLPPAEVEVESDVILKEIRRCSAISASISHAKELLHNTKALLQVIKSRLGVENEFYLKLSTRVLRLALAHVIERINDAQENLPTGPLFLLSRDIHIVEIRDVLQRSWEIIQLMSFFDMENTFKISSYQKNRKIIKKICKRAEIPTFSFLHVLRKHPVAAFVVVLLMIVSVLLTQQSIKYEEAAKERNLYNEYQTLKTKQDLEFFINKYKRGSYKFSNTSKLTSYLAESEKKLAEIKKKEEFEEKQILEKEYKSLKTKQDLELFVDKYKRDSYKFSNTSNLTSYLKDAKEKLDSIKEEEKRVEFEQNWGTETRAWSTATSQNTVASYEYYLSLYPGGSHVEQARKGVIDLEVANVFDSGDYGKLPPMNKESDEYYYSDTTTVKISNDTQYTLTLSYSGKESTRLVIPPHESKTVSLPSASYRIVASVNASNIRSFAGTEKFSGGQYTVTYYIATHPSSSYHRNIF